MTSIRSNNKSLKYQRFTTLGFKDKGIRKSEFVATIYIPSDNFVIKGYSFLDNEQTIKYDTLMMVDFKKTT